MKKYPNSANLCDSLATAYEQAGRLGEAIEAQQMAVRKAQAGPNSGDIQGVGFYEMRLEKLKAKAANDLW